VSAWPEIIVPIHDGAAVLAACLASLRETLPADARVQLVDDASRDPAVAAQMDAFAKNAPCEVVTHRQFDNLGFVATVNAAMARATGDVVLLNSDTITTPGWLQRIAACAASDARIATITPFSNNAEICSLPDFCRANPIPADPALVARACAEAGAPTYPDLPTAVGFCMFIRRAALTAIGDFDAATYGRGYGEENDFCLRAAAHGWRNVLCDDAYVVHVGGQSFAPLGLSPGGANAERLSGRYPRYNALVADFIARDPLRPLRERIAARLAGSEATVTERA
jgi:GT2 family glycosyltransferase